MMVEYIDTIANCVMALLAVVAFIVAFSEYCLHKRELIDVYLERSIACCQKMLEHSSRFWGICSYFFVVMLNLPLPSIIYLGIRS